MHCHEKSDIISDGIDVADDRFGFRTQKPPEPSRRLRITEHTMRIKRLTSAVNSFGQANGQRSLVVRVARSIWCAVSACLPLDLSYSDATHWISLAAQCSNMRCVHCAEGGDEDELKRACDFPEKWVAPSLEMLRRRGLCGVTVSGVGETAVREGWQGICQSFHEAGLNLTIINNFARPMSAENIAALISVDSIHISIESSDPELFALLHPGDRLATVLINIDEVRAYAESQGLPQPGFGFDIVITDKTILGVEDVVRLGLENGVTEFHFANLFNGEDFGAEIKVYRATTLPWAELSEGLACLERAIGLAKNAGCKTHCESGLLNSLRTAVNKTATIRKDFSINAGGLPRGAPVLRKGMTRDCSDPWTYANLCVHGEVRPCGVYDHSVGDLRTDTLEKILNAPKLRQFRQNLLSGNLDGQHCKHCSFKPQMPIGQFRKLMSGRLLLWSLRRRVLNLLQVVTRS